MKFRKFSFVILIIMLFLAACQPESQIQSENLATPTPAAQSDGESAGDTVEDMATEVSDAVPAEATATSVEEEVAAATDAPTEAAATEVVEEVSNETTACEIKPDLAATDPGTVQLASGDVQLVEFFAFW